MKRRGLLRTLGATATVGIAGCNTGNETDTQNTTDTRTDSPTGTPTDGKAPTILDYGTEPQQHGGVLQVYMEGEDDRELGQARIAYADRELVQDLDGTEATVDGTLQDTAATSPDDSRVAYVLTDAAGNETRKQVNPDYIAPELAVTAAPTDQAGRVATTIEATDETGLAEVQALLGDTTVQNADLNGTAQYSNDPTLIASKDQRGRNVSVGARVRDWNGNTTEKDIESYVRKYDKMQDTRLRVGTVYQPYFGFKEKVPENCLDERVPTVGQYELPLPFEVFNRHIDQMTGHGIDRVMIEFLGNETGPHDKRFLESDLIDQIQIEPFYTAAPNLWREGYWSTVESYKDDLVEPHMTFMRDNILSRDNATTYDGRPVVQMWNAVIWVDDYVYGRIMEEWGSYDNFFDDIRSLLTVDGKDPFFVGGTNWWGHGGYPGGRQAELTKHFDATTTWILGKPLHDGFESQESALSWVEENWRGHREFTDSHNMDFVPMVYPGFNERTADGETCGDRGGRRIPRGPGFFSQMLELADEYRTTDMVNNSVYNNWIEATHIEPGTFEPGPFGDETYGTAYLEKVAQFQRGDGG